MNDLLSQPERECVPVSQDLFVAVDKEDYEWLMQWSWCLNSAGYAVRGERRNGKNKLILMHREIIVRMGCELSKGDYGDHINGNPLDNRRANLRPATPQQSACNATKVNKHGYRGILFAPYCYKNQKQYERKKPWQARIRIKEREGPLSLGYYPTALEAAIAYDEAAKHYHGEYATLNFPEGGTR